LSYFLFKKGTSPYALPIFYITMVIFVLAALVGSSLSSLTALRKLEISKSARRGAIVGLSLMWIGLLYLSLFDVPRTFSRDIFLQRITQNEELINSEREKLRATQDELSNAKAQASLLSIDKNNAQAAAADSQKKYEQSQTAMLSAQQQLSTLTLAQRQAQVDLADAQRQISSMKQEILTLKKGYSIDSSSSASPSASTTNANLSINNGKKHRRVAKRRG